MTFSREVNQRAWPVLSENSPYRIPVSNIRANKMVAGVALYRFKIAEVPRIGEIVQIDDRRFLCLQPMQDEIRSDKSCSTRNHDWFFHMDRTIVNKKCEEPSSSLFNLSEPCLGVYGLGDALRVENDRQSMNYGSDANGSIDTFFSDTLFAEHPLVRIYALATGVDS